MPEKYTYNLLVHSKTGILPPENSSAIQSRTKNRHNSTGLAVNKFSASKFRVNFRLPELTGTMPVPARNMPDLPVICRKIASKIRDYAKL